MPQSRELVRTAELLAGELAERRHHAVAELFASAHAKPPLVLWSPLADQIAIDEFGRFQDAVASLQAIGGIPLAAAFNPEQFGNLSPWLMQLECIANSTDLNYKYYGSGIAEHYGKDMTGRSVFDFGGHISTFFAGLYLAAVRRREAVYSEHEPPARIFVRNWQRLLVPLANDRGEVIEFAVCNIPENPLRAGLDILPDPAFVFDQEKRLRFANKPSLSLMKWSERPAGFSLGEFLDPTVCRKIEELTIGGSRLRCQTSLAVQPNRHFDLVAGHVRQAGQLLWVVTIRDVTKRVRDERKIKRLAESDALTAIANRRKFETELHRLIAEKTPFAIFLVDLNGFKSINDRYGHPIGDELLKAVAKRLKRRCRPDACVARIGGDEFGLLLPGISDLRGAEARRRSLAAAFADPFRFDGAQVSANAGIGFAVFASDARDRDTLMRLADRDLYEQKALSRAFGH